MENFKVKLENNSNIEFKKRIEDVYKNCLTNESYANITEFADEDGVVIMTVTSNEDGSMLFRFGDDKEFLYHPDKNDFKINIGESEPKLA